MRPDLTYSEGSDTKVSTVNLVNGMRYTSGILATKVSSGIVECAAICFSEDLCSAFNYGSGRCQLLSAEPSCRTASPEWIHGQFPGGNGIGKCHPSGLRDHIYILVYAASPIK